MRRKRKLFAAVGDKVRAYLACVISQCGGVIKQASPWWNSMVTPKMLLIHGELDDFVHYSQSQKIAQRNGLNNSEVIIVPGAGHTGVEFNTPKLDEAILSLVFSFN